MFKFLFIYVLMIWSSYFSEIGLYFFTFSARGQVNRNEYYYDRTKNDRNPSLYAGTKLEDNIPIVIDRSRDRYYYNPGINKPNDEWQ